MIVFIEICMYFTKEISKLNNINQKYSSSNFAFKVSDFLVRLKETMFINLMKKTKIIQ